MKWLTEHPYWECFSRAVVTAVFQSFAIIVLVNKAILAIFFIEWIAGWRHSRNTQMRIESCLPHYNVVWGLGKSVGAIIGVILSTLYLHPHDWGWLNPETWPSVHWIWKIASWFNGALHL